MLYFPSMNIYDQIKVSATNTKFKDDKMSHSRPMIGCMRSEDVFTHRRICFLLVPTVGAHCAHCWCPLDAKQDKLPAFLGTESFSGRQTQVTDTQEIPLTYPRTNCVIILPWSKGGKHFFCCCNHHRHCS